MRSASSAVPGAQEDQGSDYGIVAVADDRLGEATLHFLHQNGIFAPRGNSFQKLLLVRNTESDAAALGLMLRVGHLHRDRVRNRMRKVGRMRDRARRRRDAERFDELEGVLAHRSE